MPTGHVTELTSAAPDFFADPYSAYRKIGADGPVRQLRMPGGETVWMVFGYDTVRTALADSRLCNDSRHSAAYREDDSAVGRNMLKADPPDHTRLRTLVSRQFTARRIGKLRSRIEEISAELLDAVASSGRTDLVSAYAIPLPITAICELLGVPAADRETFLGWSNKLVDVTGPEAAAAAGAAAAAMTEYLTGLIEEKRRRTAGADADLLHVLARAQDEDNDRLSPDELLGMAFLLLVAGHETTVNLISSAVHLLLRNPDQLAALRADPGLLDGTIEETLRYEPPIQVAAYRYTSEPLTLAGTDIPQGERVVLSLASANRDAAYFPDPDRFDIHRDLTANRAQLAFSHGIHYCLGAQLARLEAVVALTDLLKRFPGLALDEAAAPEWRPSLLRGLRTLPVRW
ncbi:cytochrome P450 [Streptomyces olivoverticillatus]|uniref:Cytochrome P450 n=1 Tax=Streptomyces olivoverticillatus TaxID=66427 RepID=A0A7W7PN05_9ACTN|nr:cytochrome P450 [Streptomyces olivoverticillatus]MBB4895924.1 cytochrome P450 [Streptomyces olivoverticillatus]